MDKRTFEKLLVQLNPIRRAAGRLQRQRIPFTESVLVGLWAHFNTDTFRSAGSNFSYDQKTVWVHYRHLVKDLCDLGARYVKWPNDRGRRKVSDYFEDNFGVPGVVGIVDGTTVKITVPSEQKQRYVDHKGNYSINVMLVVNHERVITYASTGQPGSVNDARVFKRSGLARNMYGGAQNIISPDEHLLGDKAYNITPKLITPYKLNEGNTPSHRYFNQCLSQCRATVERTNALWKGQMAKLGRVLFCKSVRNTITHIMACVCLHNFIQLKGEEPEGVVFQGPLPQVDVHRAVAAEKEAGQQKREFLRVLTDQMAARAAEQ